MATGTLETATDGRLLVLRVLSQDLIVAEIEELNKRVRMERAIQEAAKTGVPTDEISEATGLQPSAVRDISAKSHQDELDLDKMLGIT